LLAFYHNIELGGSKESESKIKESTQSKLFFNAGRLTEGNGEEKNSQ
jgi:hypothetical protein